ncbi:MAG: threonine-phosphate decarboxylase [Actinobacteria bacterium]|nr:threonine-phosphate decarboxylase [Actinomycetota bacterium]
MKYPAHGGDLRWAADRYGLRPEEFLDFSANVNPLGTPRGALEAARRALRGLPAYPEPQAESLRAELAGFLGKDPSLLTLGNGSTELIHNLARALAPRRVLVVAPAFTEYARAAELAGARVAHHLLSPADGFRLRAEELAREAARADAVFFCNPASPTGALYRRDELLPLLEACRRMGVFLAVDESFMGFCAQEEAAECSLLEMAGGEGLAVFSTFTKLYALAGLRGPGWLAGPRGLVAGLEESGIPWRVNAVAAAAARACLADAGYLRRTREAVRRWRDELSVKLEKTGIFQVFPSHANYLLLRARAGAAAAGELVERLGRRGILVRPCGDFAGLDGSFLRVAVRRPGDNRRLLDALRETSP